MLTRSLGPGVVGMLSLALLGILCVPNAAVWAAGYAGRPGFGSAPVRGERVRGHARPRSRVPAAGRAASAPAPPTAARLVLRPAHRRVVAGVLVRPGPGRPPKVAPAGRPPPPTDRGLAFAVLAALSGGPLGSGS